MMNKDDSVLVFQKLLKLRSLFKSVTQISWNIASLEKRFDITKPISEKKVKEILAAYKEQATWLDETNSKLKELL